MGAITKGAATPRSEVTSATLLARFLRSQNDPVLQRIKPKGLPILYEDEGTEMGESSLHTLTCNILLCGLEFHLTGRAGYRVFGNLNLYYADDDQSTHVSPDAMVVKPAR